MIFISSNRKGKFWKEFSQEVLRQKLLAHCDPGYLFFICVLFLGTLFQVDTIVNFNLHLDRRSFLNEEKTNSVLTLSLQHLTPRMLLVSSLQRDCYHL